MKPYKQLEHTADLRIRVYGTGRRALLQNSLRALADILTDRTQVRARTSRRLSLRASSFDLLLVRFLRELLFLFDTRRFLPRGLEFIRLDDKVLEAKVRGERFSPKRHPLKTEVKAATYHGLKVERRKGKWVAEVIFDV